MDHIKNYWESQAEQHKTSHWASWGDNLLIDLEIRTISKYIKCSDRVADIGCANGFSTFSQYELRKPASIIGVDYAEKMIEYANNAKNEKYKNSPITFQVGDIRSLALANSSFDVVYTTRVLINLPSWEEQKRGLTECLRVARPGGLVIISEGFWEPLCKLNAIRLLCGLPPLVEHDFNRYLKLSRISEHLNDLGLRFKVEDFSSIYYLGSRILRELVTDSAKYPGFSNPINRDFYEIQKTYAGGGLGIQQALIINKI
jgi:SAM-dependent methyltransferase